MGGNKMNNDPVVVEYTFQAPIHKVWRAITSRDDMEQWYFTFVEFKPEVGFEFRFMGGTPERQYLHVCKITEVEAGKKLAYTWRYDGFEGISTVTFELHAGGDQTRLILIHEGLETFPGDNPDFAKENFVQGWTQIIGTSLKEFLEKRP
jgi:uncharacterized protein YndB with AHSA1/START domain